MLIKVHDELESLEILTCVKTDIVRYDLSGRGLLSMDDCVCSSLVCRVGLILLTFLSLRSFSIIAS